MRLRLDRVGLLVAVIVAGALAFEPFVMLRPNRIVSGRAIAFLPALPPSAGALALAALLLSAGLCLVRGGPWPRLALAALMLAVLALAIGLAPAHLLPPENTLARLSPAAGFWLLLLAAALLLTDAVAVLRPPPLLRLAGLVLLLAALAALLASGLWNRLSIMQEYATHADSFWRELARHLELAFASTAAAVAVGLPLGIACDGAPALRALVLGLLNVVQTVPSIAMYGLMMVPLGLLAAHLPLAAALGISGIGAAPALIALFLYALLPVVANVVVGLRQVPPQTMEAARGMGMTDRRRLLAVALPLAAPVILAGIRIVLVQTIGLVAIAALIGGGGLGTFIFQGIGQAASDLVLLGAVPTVILAVAAAIVLDALTEMLPGVRA